MKKNKKKMKKNEKRRKENTEPSFLGWKEGSGFWALGDFGGFCVYFEAKTIEVFAFRKARSQKPMECLLFLKSP
jgi:hypothetical protein